MPPNPKKADFTLLLLALAAILISLWYLSTHPLPKLVEEVEAQTVNTTHSEIKMYGVKESYEATVTAYTAWETCKDGLLENCMDASGAQPRVGKTVACPRSIPLGTNIYIEEIGHRTCNDRTSLQFGTGRSARFDVFVRDYKDALRFGKQTLTIFVLE